MKRRHLLVAAVGLPWRVRAQLAESSVGASSASPAAWGRWRAEIGALLAADERQAPALGGVVFVGSSTIRLWRGLTHDFDAWAPHVLRRGLGGSRLSEWPELVPWLVTRYVPRQVVVYAGENDIADGASPHEVLAAYVRFVQAVWLERPDTPIAFVSIKPSPSRLAHLSAVREANLLIQTWTLAQDGLDYIDVHTPMLDVDGQPRAELFVRDRLHLSAEGYALWRQVISAHLKP
ncbi:MAG: GDSL family lipase [Hydrogenophaga sp.]|uniref:GDSL-type esterase/lipase family protein n=1 Tax=Hydrogenophaga sp. TaxID=1904254 RepID=UPI001DB01ED8|nr:GDSL-type esterase/lipase family protein [Hydrogenophaga sp.]MBX3611373.1 GDSL family lipase [Hydrogenophaga sp.]